MTETPHHGPCKVLIGVPSGDLVHANFAFSLASMERNPALPTQLWNVKSSIIPLNRNMIVERAQQIGAEYILMIDSDISFPADAVSHLFSEARTHNRDIIGGTYLIRAYPHRQVVHTLDGKDGEMEGVVEVARMPTGFLMIRTTVFDKLDKPYFRFPVVEKDGKMQILGEDYDFCDRARAAGFRIWMDIPLSVNLIHWGTVGVRWTTDAQGYGYEFK